MNLAIRPPLPAFVLALSLSALVGCDKGEAKQPTDAAGAVAVPSPAVAPANVATVDPAVAAKEIFALRCTPCHGAGGAGDGPASATLTPRPANFTDPAWQGAVTDDHIEKIIAYGGIAVGKSAAMPANPDLDGKPVIPALRALIRGLKK